MENTKTMENTMIDNSLVMDATSIADKSAFLQLSFGMLGNTRKVKRVSTIVLNEETSVSVTERYKTTMRLLESKELNEIRNADVEFRKELQKYCLPAFPSVLAVPKNAVSKIAYKCKEYAKEREKLVEVFLNAYDSLKWQAELDLGPCFNPENYPERSKVAGAFYFKFQFVVFGVPAMLEEIDPELYQEQAKQAEKTLVAAAHEMAGFMRASILELVSHLADKLSPNSDGKPKRLHQTAIDNINEFLSSFQLRNVTNDAQLEAQMAQLRAVMSGTTADNLRESEVFKSATLEKLSGIKNNLAALVEESGRVFRSDDED